MIGQHQQLNRPVSLEEATAIREQAEKVIQKYDSIKGEELRKVVLPALYETQNLANALVLALAKKRIKKTA